MRILQLISSGGCYGAEKVVLNLATALAELGHEPHMGVFLNSHAPNTQLALEARHRKLPVDMFRCRGRIDPVAVRRIRQYIAQNGIQVVHCHGYKADLYGYAAARKSSAVAISTCHNWTDTSPALRLYGMLDRIILRRFPKVVAVSEQIAGLLRKAGLSPSQVHIIGNGVDASEFCPRPGLRPEGQGRSGLISIGFVGRLTKEKGAVLFLQAAHDLYLSHQEARFAFYGDGPERKQLEALASSLGIADRVTFHGRIGNMAPAFAALHMTVLPSYAEGMPMSILESLSCATPVVASRVGQIPSLLAERRCGLLVEPGSKKGLVDAMAQLIDNPALRKRMGENGRQLVQQAYTSERMATRYIEIYQSCAASGASNAALRDDPRPTTITRR